MQHCAVMNYQQRIGLDPLEQRSGGSLPATGGGFHASPIEQRSGGSLPLTGGFHASPIEQSGGSLPSTASPWGRSVPSAPAGGMSSIYSMFFGD
jgi:hypothetical protein